MAAGGNVREFLGSSLVKQEKPRLVVRIKRAREKTKTTQAAEGQERSHSLGHRWRPPSEAGRKGWGEAKGPGEPTVTPQLPLLTLEVRSSGRPGLTRGALPSSELPILPAERSRETASTADPGRGLVFPPRRAQPLISVRADGPAEGEGRSPASLPRSRVVT